MALPSVSVSAVANGDEANGSPVLFRFSRSGSTAAPLTVSYRLLGTAQAGKIIPDIPVLLLARSHCLQALTPSTCWCRSWLMHGLILVKQSWPELSHPRQAAT
jgi:hypothetical protein